jgi:hypothetical protein
MDDLMISDDEHLQELVDLYVENRDPKAITDLIHQNVDLLSTAPIGRLFLKLLNNSLPSMKNRPNRENKCKSHAIDMVLFNLGSGMKKTQCYEVLGNILPVHRDTIRTYFDEFIENIAIDNDIDKKIVWEALLNADSQYIDIFMREPFEDGRCMIDDELASRLKPESYSIDKYREMIRENYTYYKAPTLRDPWKVAAECHLIQLEGANLDSK